MTLRSRLLPCAFAVGVMLVLPTVGRAQQDGARVGSGPIVDGDETRHALIYVYRNAGWAGRALEPPVLLDGVELATMDNKRYFSVWVEPGEHLISAGGGMTQACSPTRQSFGAGNVYYLEIRLLQANGAGCFYPDTIPNATFAKDEIAKLKPLNQDNVRHPAVRRQ